MIFLQPFPTPTAKLHKTQNRAQPFLAITVHHKRKNAKQAAWGNADGRFHLVIFFA